MSISALILFFPVFPVIQTNALAIPAQEEIIWRCWASGAERSYQVEELDRTASRFRLNVYVGDVSEANQIDEVPITVDDVAARSLTGQGRTANGIIQVQAFGGGLSFQVQHSRYGTASGQCHRIGVEMN